MIKNHWQKIQVLMRELVCTRSPGQTNVEYALILLLVGVASAAALIFFGGVVANMMTNVNGTLIGRIVP